MALVLAPLSLAQMEHDPDTRVADFFAAWNRDLSPSMCTINDTICDRLINTHGRGRFSSLFKLSRSVAEEVVTSAGGTDGWVKTIEELSGFTFATPTAPTSAQLAGLSSGVAKAPKPKARPTLSDTLVSDEDWEAERIPDGCFSVVRCANPTSDELGEKDISAFTDVLLEWVMATHGALNLGAPLTRHLAAQVTRRFPHLPDRGKTAGRSRDWFGIIQEKAKNRQHVRAALKHAAPTPSPPLCPQLELLSLAEAVRQEALDQRHRPVHRRRDLQGVEGGRALRPE